MEVFAKPAVGGIIEQNIDGIDCILVQERCKEDAKSEYGLLEIPAGKVRAFESIFDCLRREIWEETGLTLTEIQGEKEAKVYEANDYRVIHYEPFSSSQNIIGTYPIMVQIFICHAEGDILKQSNESKNIRWMPVLQLQSILDCEPDSFYPMHVDTLRKYISCYSTCEK